ncbi:MAG: ABC transporter ATP-binding protein [gamma proteobacterium symbiont of Taylorina sp.]|nr:ABC transporter ATP-binding protein [gamma proteobacterium symbiont of Taylorina sp.]
MEDDILIVENVSKKFCRSLKRSMLYGIQDISKDILGLSVNSNLLRSDEFWAFEDLSFSLKKGESLGIIGPNGSGKSTLFKMLSGIMLPDKGKITIKGSLGALIEVGAGFHPLLSGRENIYINASILGMKKKEIDHKFDEIVDFSGLEEFIDMPVKNYSSGMYVRLGFSVAVHVVPDVLLVDEVLAVGDAKFRAKSLKKMSELMQNGTSILLVSHHMHLIDKVADNSLYIERGCKALYGSTSDMIDRYHQCSASGVNDNSKFESDNLKVTQVLINEKKQSDSGKQLIIRAEYQCKKEIKGFFGIAIHAENGDTIMNYRTDCEGHKVYSFKQGSGFFKLILENLLEPGIYSVSVSIFDENNLGSLVQHLREYPLVISGGKNVYGYINMPHYWESS